MHRNPVAATDRPEAEPADPDIRFLDLSELEALLRVTLELERTPAEGETNLTAPACPHTTK